ncbi:MAG: sigma-70 family RNA polymerase sigma factor [Acidobacteria bacterium]|nr:sigma-70 family RNA polymerase sigma factor [Acidobacteriota bacterium]
MEPRNHVVLKRASWNLTQEAFAKFLACLDANTTRAGELYEKIRAKLISFFAWRGFQFAEDHADEAINRVIRKIDEGEEIRDPSTYVYGVARMLILELAKEREKQNAAFDNLPPPIAPEAEADDDSQMRVECLQRCLQSLSPDNRALILGYYQEDKGAKVASRKLLAERLQIPLNALRIRALRLRDKLETCINSGLQQMSRGRSFGANLSPLGKKWN